ncbi:MAG: F0F1 ATP synthase subunit A [Clostridia bacterium]|nr:F0F1 ATP synthase subunit A [Clostridia bacterium]
MTEEKKKKVNIKVSTVVVFTLIALLVAAGFFINSIGFEGDHIEQPNIAGARVLFRIDFSKPAGIRYYTPDESGEQQLVSPLSVLTVTTTHVNSFIVVAVIGLLCFWLTRDLKVKPEGKKQILAEFIVEKVTHIVTDNMSEAFEFFAPFITALLGLSALSSLTSLLGWYPPTAELNTILGWSLIVFILITYQKLRSGVGEYLKGYTKPIFIMIPMNILGEVATPMSMAFRHFGNVCSGMVISALLAWALTGLSKLVWGLINVGGWLSDFAFFRIGIPAVMSVYFDIFSGCLQAFIFCMLTMINIYLAYEDSNETIAEKKRKKEKKLAEKAAKAAKKA